MSELLSLFLGHFSTVCDVCSFVSEIYFLFIFVCHFDGEQKRFLYAQKSFVDLSQVVSCSFNRKMLESAGKVIVGCICGVICILLLIYLAYYQFRRSYPKFITLPGPFKYIGVSYHPIPNKTRFKIFYPTSKPNIESFDSVPPNTYCFDPPVMDSLSRTYGLPKLVLNALNNLEALKYDSPYYLNAPISHPHDPSSKYPLLLFSHGAATNFDLYTNFCCGLASYGVIVAIMDHTDSSALYTKLSDGTDLLYEPTHTVDGVAGKTYDDDVAIYGQKQLKPIRVPEFKAFYEYLRSDEIEDESLRAKLENADFENVIFGGHSFGGVTSWMASRDYQDEGNLKCLLLLDPWFGCLDKSELEQMNWSLPAYAMSSAQWIEERQHLTSCTQKVMQNGTSNTTVWEYAKRSQHEDYCDVPFWAPSFVVQMRKGYTAQQWMDLVMKRSMSFVVKHIPTMNQWVAEEHLQYDYGSLVKCNIQDNIISALEQEPQL